MDSPKLAQSHSDLQQIRAGLKQWEHNFQKEHSRAPCKADVQACVRIRKLYRQYSTLKLELGKENQCEAKKVGNETSAQTCSVDAARTPLISRGSNVNIPSSRNVLPQPARPPSSSDDPSVSQVSPVPSMLSSSQRSPCGKNLRDCLSALEGGSVIRLRRIGLQSESREGNPFDDPLPAGFCSIVGPSSLLKRDLQSCSSSFDNDSVATEDGNFGKPSPSSAFDQGDHSFVKDEDRPENIVEELRAAPVRSQSGRTANKPRQQFRAEPAERENFVRLNINGRGSKKRKFSNKHKSGRPQAYGRRRTYGAKRKKKIDVDASDNAFNDEDIETPVDSGRKRQRNCGPSANNTLWANDGWLEPETCKEGLQDGVDNLANELTGKLQDVINEAQKSPSDENLIEVLRLAFGFKDFRDGQLEAIRRVISSLSTMVILPTGMGKSLCYQLPAYLLPGMILVISPLMALMTDQLQRLPPSLSGALISSSQTPQESSATIARVCAGQVKILFISPERLSSESFLSTLCKLPKISLAVVDEAHCLSEWSHNFRPSYFRLGKALQQMSVSSVLALTATATKKAERSILTALSIPAEGIVQTSHIRENLTLSVSRAAARLKSLLSLLQSSPCAEAKSIIIYCTFQVETDRICAFLQQNGIRAQSYHSKKASQERDHVYNLFSSNKLRVVVATVAFGMGLDKSDVRAIIHYNIPRSLEAYVQETGRAGRDGKSAYCHLFLDDGDYLKLRSLAYSDGVDQYSVNKFLCRVFTECSEARPGNVMSITIETASRELDMKEEVMETILSYLEGGDMNYVKVHSKLNATCTLGFYKSSLTSLASKNIFAAAVIKRSKVKDGRYVFSIPSVATEIQWSLFDVQSELRRLQIAGEITYEADDPALCFTVLQMPADICLLTSEVTSRLAEAEQCKVRKVDVMYSAASAALPCAAESLPQQETELAFPRQHASLQSLIEKYFKEEESPACPPAVVDSKSSFVQADIKVFVKSSRHMNLTGRAVARIFHGLWSPAFPYTEWSKNHFWGRHVGVDFEVIRAAAAREILSHHVTNRSSLLP